MTATPILRFEDVSLHFGDVPALENVSFEMRAGETRIVLGAAGSGKTMLVKSAMGLQPVDSGRIVLMDQEVTAMKESQLFELRSNVGVLFQEGGLFDSMTVGRNVAYPLLYQKAHREVSHGAQLEERVREALRFVELDQTLDKFPSELSGGMRRRVGIARAVVTQPALVLYDSPTAGLDPITANTIISLIIKERDSRNTAAIMVTYRYQDGHLMANFRYNPNSGHIERIADGGGASSDGGHSLSTQFLVLNQGRLVFEGSQAELKACDDPYVKKFVK
jgi:phospholipid/cholesterol/gamma-HCH transport system ATP-binding protein